MLFFRLSLFLALFRIAQVHTEECPPTAIIIFGASGDLTERKLVPALYNLAHVGYLSEKAAIIGFSRRDYTDHSFRKKLRDTIQHGDDWQSFESRLFYHQSDLDSDKGYEDLKDFLAEIDESIGTEGNRIYYLATPPSHFPLIIEKLHKNGLLYDAKRTSDKWSRVIIEKTFGEDLDSAIKLDKHIATYLDESQIYLMDHYLGKAGVQNLLPLRFENKLFEPLWNNEHIDSIQITLSEEIGIGARGHFFEETGLLRDVVQNHVMQIFALIAMEQPNNFDAENIHKEKITVLNAIRPFLLEEHPVLRGQYVKGCVHGKEVRGYRQEKGVSEDSLVETFVFAKLSVDTPRWEGVPFYIRAGKRLEKQSTEVTVNFKTGSVLYIHVQPNPRIVFQSAVPLHLDFETDNTQPKEAYEKLLYDCARGDNRLFAVVEEHLAAWRLFTPVLNYWKAHPEAPMEEYEAGTYGPLIE